MHSVIQLSLDGHSLSFDRRLWNGEVMELWNIEAMPHEAMLSPDSSVLN
jgi:hypothetical protein